MIERKLWAFLNLKYLRYAQAIAKMETPLGNVRERVVKEHKSFSFVRIKVYAESQIGNGKVENVTQTEVEYQSAKKVEEEYTTPKKKRGGIEKIEVNIDIKQRNSYTVLQQQSPSRVSYPQQSPSRGNYPQQSSSRINFGQRSPSYSRGSYHIQQPKI